MSLEVQTALAWTFVQEVPTPDEINQRLVEGEVAWASYKTVRDTATITNKRILLADRQGLRGKKIEVYTIPFKSVILYSTENAHGLLDFNAELQLWTRAGTFKLKLGKGVDIAKLDWLVANALLLHT